MSVTIEDLKPKPFKVNVKGVELECQPVRLAHALSLAKLGNIFQNPGAATKEQIDQAQKDFDALVSELIPELAGVSLDMGASVSLLTQMMETVEPSDNKELKEKGVSFDTDPKA